MPIDDIQIRQITSQQKSEIIDLRKIVFKAKYGEAVDVSGLEWNRTDEYGVHFGAYRGERLISVLRLSLLTDPKEFFKLLQYPYDGNFCLVPSYCLARAATALDEKNQSVNMRLRQSAFEYILANSKQAQYVYGTTLAESQRLRFLEELGYEVLVHQNSWQGYLSSQGKSIALFRLDISKIEKAIQKLQMISARAQNKEISL